MSFTASPTASPTPAPCFMYSTTDRAVQQRIVISPAPVHAVAPYRVSAYDPAPMIGLSPSRPGYFHPQPEVLVPEQMFAR